MGPRGHIPPIIWLFSTAVRWVLVPTLMCVHQQLNPIATRVRTNQKRLWKCSMGPRGHIPPKIRLFSTTGGWVLVPALMCGHQQLNPIATRVRTNQKRLWKCSMGPRGHSPPKIRLFLTTGGWVLVPALMCGHQQLNLGVFANGQDGSRSTSDPHGSGFENLIGQVKMVC